MVSLMFHFAGGRDATVTGLRVTIGVLAGACLPSPRREAGFELG